MLRSFVVIVLFSILSEITDSGSRNKVLVIICVFWGLGNSNYVQSITEKCVQLLQILFPHQMHYKPIQFQEKTT